MHTIFSRLLPLACGALLIGPCAHAQQAPAQEAAPSWSANAALVSQYVSRGFRQTWGKPALQAGVDLVHPSGWSAGTWVSNVSERYIEGGTFEWDLYGGYSGVAGPVGYSLAALVYRYPGARIAATGTRFDYAELSAGLTYGALYAKYNRSLTRDFFGIADARGTTYVDAGANLAFGSHYTLDLHAGQGRVAGPGNASWDWRDVKAGVTRTLADGWSVAGSYTRAYGATDAYDRYTTGVPDAAGRLAYSNPAEGTFVLSLARTF